MISQTKPSTTWVERYETLRRHVLNDYHVFDSEPLSLVLWLAYGMAGWMCQWAKAVEVAPSPAVVPLQVRFAATSICQQQLTLLLAHITVQRLYPAPSL